MGFYRISGWWQHYCLDPQRNEWVTLAKGVTCSDCLKSEHDFNPQDGRETAQVTPSPLSARAPPAWWIFPYPCPLKFYG